MANFGKRDRAYRQLVNKGDAPWIARTLGERA